MKMSQSCRNLLQNYRLVWKSYEKTEFSVYLMHNAFSNYKMWISRKAASQGTMVLLRSTAELKSVSVVLWWQNLQYLWLAQYFLAWRAKVYYSSVPDMDREGLIDTTTSHVIILRQRKYKFTWNSWHILW